MALTALSQLSSISSLPLRRRLSVLPLGNPRRQDRKECQHFRSESSFGHNGDALRLYTDGTSKSYLHTEGIKRYEEEAEIGPQKRAAQIFVLGLHLVRGLIFGGGLFEFIFSRNPAALRTNVVIGSAILALSILSLKIWRSGKSSLRFILGQIALSATLLWKPFHTYTLVKKPFPALFYVLINALMICFYSYVILAGGKPPPRKSKSSAYMNRLMSHGIQRRGIFWLKSYAGGVKSFGRITLRQINISKVNSFLI